MHFASAKAGRSGELYLKARARVCLRHYRSEVLLRGRIDDELDFVARSDHLNPMRRVLCDVVATTREFHHRAEGKEHFARSYDGHPRVAEPISKSAHNPGG